MRTIGMAAAVLVAALAAGCEANAHEDLVNAAKKLPPQDTLAGAYAPASATATGGALATPPAPGAPASADTAAATRRGAAAPAASTPAARAPAAAKR